MQGFLIDPTTKTIVPVEYNGDYKTIYDHIGARTFDVVRIDHDDAIYIDDEGLLVDEPGPFFTYNGHTLAGKGLVLGTDSEGETIAAKSTQDELTERVAFPNLKLLGFEHQEGYIEHPILGRVFQVSDTPIFEAQVPVTEEAPFLAAEMDELAVSETPTGSQE